MPTIARTEALEQLAKEVERFAPDELLEVYNEMFPKNPSTEEAVRKDPRPLVERIVTYLKSLEMDMLVLMWRLIFIKHSDAWYNEEDDLIYFDEEEAFAE
jgi:hypothetical protein